MMTPQSTQGRGYPQKEGSIVKQGDARWGVAKKDPVWAWEPDGGAGTTGRIIHTETGQVMRRVRGKWQGVRR
jgi:hypothetical protein